MCDISDMQQLSDHIAARPGKTYGEWAQDFGVSRPYLYGLLDGTRSPSLATAQRIAAATGNDVPITAWPNLAAIIAAGTGAA